MQLFIDVGKTKKHFHLFFLIRSLRIEKLINQYVNFDFYESIYL